MTARADSDWSGELAPPVTRPVRPDLTAPMTPVVSRARVQLCESVGCLALAGVVVVSCLSLLGWLTGQEWLKRFYRVSMPRPFHGAANPLALLALLAIAALLLRSRNRLSSSSGYRLAQAALGLVVFGISVVFLLDRLHLVAFPLDEWASALFRTRTATPSHDRITKNTAIGMGFAGLAVMAFASRKPRWVDLGQLVSVGLFLFSLLAVIGHVWHRPESSPVSGPLRPMPLPTAFGLSLLSIGLLGLLPTRGPVAILTHEGPGGQLARRLIPACLLLPSLIGGLLAAFGGQQFLTTPQGLSAVVSVVTVVLISLAWTQAWNLDQVEKDRLSTLVALQRSELFFHTLVETLPQNILIKDAEGRFTFVNRRFCQTMGKPHRDLIGKTDADLYPRNLAEKYRRDDHHVMEQGVSLETVEENVTPDGKQHFVQVIKTPIQDSDRRVIGVQGMFWDVTAERLAAARLRDQNTQLQEMAASEKRAHEQLKRAQSHMVQNAKLAGLGQMVAGVAHEINNPLSFVINNLVVLQRDLSEVFEVLRGYRETEPVLAQHAAEQAERLGNLWADLDMDYTLENLPTLISRTNEGLGRIQRIVKDLKVFARVDEERLVETDLNEGVSTTVHIVQGTARARDVVIDLDLQPMRPVYCQAPKINQVVMNLVSNAIEACSSGGHIQIRSRDGDDQVTLEVEDNGSGIPPQVVDRIFDPFFTTKPVGEGTGLGLSISYGILKEHQGDIEVDSVLGKGTRFTIRLPRNLEHRVGSMLGARGLGTEGSAPKSVEQSH